MTTQLLPDIGRLIEGIVAARTIDNDRKLALLEQLRHDGPTDSLLATIDTLFAAEMADAMEELACCEAMLPRLRDDADAEETAVVPALQSASIELRSECDAFMQAEKMNAADIERSADTILRTSSADADANDADAIRKSLGLNS